MNSGIVPGAILYELKRYLIYACSCRLDFYHQFVLKIKRAWKIYLCGFGFAIKLRRLRTYHADEVFETDDIINNTIGAMIGYGLFSVARPIWQSVQGRKSEDNTNEVMSTHDENKL